METVAQHLSASRPLYVAEVVPHAKSSCSKCKGQGYLTKIFHAGAKGEQKQLLPCPCALKGFKRAHDADVITVDNEMRWRPGRAPPPGAPTR